MGGDDVQVGGMAFRGAIRQLEQLVRSLYDNYYKEEIGIYSDTPGGADAYLYRPLKYWLFGNYDLALISELRVNT